MLAPRELATDLRCGLDPVAFAVERLRFTPDSWQAEVMRAPAGRLLLNCSRQVGKSTTCAIIALHQALYRPGSLILLVSPSLRQSQELFSKVTGFLKTLETRPALDQDNALSLMLDSGSRVVSLPGTAATVRGYSAVDLLVEDEAAYVPDELYAAVRPMLAVSGGRLFLLSTPFGRRGHFFEAWDDGGDEWERVEVTAEECPRILPAFLERERAALGEAWYGQEYRCKFVETLDQVFRYDDIKRAFTDEVRPLFGEDRGDEVAPLFPEAVA